MSSPPDGALLFPQGTWVVVRQVVSSSQTQEDHKAPARDVERIQRRPFTGDLPLMKQRMGAGRRGFPGLKGTLYLEQYRPGDPFSTNCIRGLVSRTARAFDGPFIPVP